MSWGTMWDREMVWDSYYGPSLGLTIDVDNIGDAGADVRQWVRAWQSPHLTQRLQRVLVMGGTGHCGQLRSMGVCDLHGQEPVSSMSPGTLLTDQSRVLTCLRSCVHTLNTNTGVVGAAVVVTRLPAPDNNNILHNSTTALATQQQTPNTVVLKTPWALNTLQGRCKWKSCNHSFIF